MSDEYENPKLPHLPLRLKPGLEEAYQRIHDLERELAEAKRERDLVGCNACRTEPTALTGCPCDHVPCIHDYNQRVHDADVAAQALTRSEERCKELEKALHAARVTAEWNLAGDDPYDWRKGLEVIRDDLARAALATGSAILVQRLEAATDAVLAANNVKLGRDDDEGEEK